MSIDKNLVDKLGRIEALFAGATTKGERVAAENAIERIKKNSKNVSYPILRLTISLL